MDFNKELLEAMKKSGCINEDTFSYNDEFTDVTIPKTVKKIGTKAFSRCNLLSSVTIPESVIDIAEGAFTKWHGPPMRIAIATGNKKYKSFGNFVFTKDGKTLIHAPDYEHIFEFVPNGVERIGAFSYYRFTNTQIIVIPESVKEIDINAFLCSEIQKIVIPIGSKIAESEDFMRIVKRYGLKVQVSGFGKLKQLGVKVEFV